MNDIERENIRASCSVWDLTGTIEYPFKTVTKYFPIFLDFMFEYPALFEYGYKRVFQLPIVPPIVKDMGTDYDTNLNGKVSSLEFPNFTIRYLDSALKINIDTRDRSNTIVNIGAK